MGLGNAFGRYEKSYNSGKNIWYKVDGVHPGGGLVDLSGYKAGDVIPAGSMVVFDQVAGTARIAAATDITTAENAAGTVAPESVRGLLANDIYVREGATAGTATVVYAGAIYSDRLAVEIPAEVWAVLPLIVKVLEK